ncbi:MAG: tetratricopeptide repeat protein [Saprospiraceae bacterium]|nr:tetratricopeptide repeat protein [Saprospiraceae bacterium]
MKKVCFSLSLMILFSIGCSNSTEKVRNEIATLETQLSDQPTEEILHQLLDKYKEMASKTSGEEHLDYLWKAGETARAAKEFDAAESMFMELYSQKESPEIAAKALFLYAFMCDEDLKEYEKAKELYARFLQNYPNSDFADDAQFLLDNLGKSDEEMLEMLSNTPQDESIEN